MRQPLLLIAPLLLLGAPPFGAAVEADSFLQIAKLKAADGAAGDEFGYGVAISGDIAIVGAFGDDDLGSSSGAAYVFERDGGAAGAWRQVAKLTAPDGGGLHRFGVSVSVSGETAIVGGAVDTVGFGAAYLFERDAGGPGTWGFIAKLVAADGHAHDNFGGSVAVDGDTAAVGASGFDGPEAYGALYVFERDAGGAGAWGQVAKLTPAALCSEIPLTSYCGWPGAHFFGSSAALSGDTLVIGGDGFAYVHKRTRAGSWRRVGRPKPFDLNGAYYGSSVAISGETALIGAFGDRDLGGLAGAAFVFEPDPGWPHPWAEVVKITAPDGQQEDWFGVSVAVSGDTAVVGADQEGRAGAGYAYVLRRDEGGPDAWGAVAKLIAVEGEPYDEFGQRVAISAETVLVGTPGDDDLGSRAGAAYLFQAAPRDPALADRQPSGLVLTAAESGSEEAMPRLSEPTAAAPASDSNAAASGLPLAAAGTLSEVQLCFRLLGPVTPYCDGLELTVSGGRVSGVWYDSVFNCDAIGAALSGTVQDGRVVVRCDADSEPCPYGFTWGWVIDLPLDGTLDMLQLDGIWNAWIDELEYTATAGECSF